MAGLRTTRICLIRPSSTSRLIAVTSPRASIRAPSEPLIHTGSTTPSGAKVAKFAETLSENVLRAGGYKTREQFVEKFAECRKKDPALTAKQYLGL